MTHDDTHPHPPASTPEPATATLERAPAPNDSRAARRTSRRGFLAAGATLAAATVAAARTAGAQQGSQGTPAKDNRIRRTVKKLLERKPDPSFDPFHPASGITSKGWDSTLVRLVRRVTNGVTPAEITLARKLGFYGYLEYHLNYTKIDDTDVENWVTANAPMVRQDSATLYSQDQGVVQSQFVDATMYRGAFSRRQLYERMVEFWRDHFNVAYSDGVQYMRVADDHDVARKYALGRFADMLRASAHSPAMLEYLDNTRNRGNNPNQNYAREVMELHTLGVDGGYTQTDVAELSRCLTGWTISSRGVGFNFDPSGHDFTQKIVLGQVIPAQSASVGQGGMYDGNFMLDFLVKHPSTAKFISKKMLKWLLRYDPSDTQIQAVADVYTKSGGDIPSMVRAIFTPANLSTTPAKYRRPYSFVIAALRATSPNMMRTNQISQRWLTTVGMPLYEWQTPDGYPDKVDYWAGGVLQRWNFATYLTTNTADAVVDMAPYIAVPTPDGLVNAIGQGLFGGEMPDTLRAQLLTYAQGGTITAARARETLALALSSSAFQWI